MALPLTTRLQGWVRRLSEAHSPEWRQRTALALSAILLALAAVTFASAGELVQRLFAQAAVRTWWLPLFLTPAIFVAVTWATRRFAPAASGSGIPQVIAVVRKPQNAARSALVSLRSAAAKVTGTLAMLAGGGAVGREGPTVQLSAAIAVQIHRLLRVPIGSGTIIAGGAAGISAAFNTPLAGVAFAIEELAAAFEQRVAVRVMAAVLVAGLVSLWLSGDYVYFGVVDQHLPILTMILGALVTGISGGVLGALFSRALLAVRRSNQPTIALLRKRPLWLAAGCGLLVAAIGIASGGLSWGTGYEGTRALLSGQSVPLVFAPARLSASFLTALTGAPGGIFAPSLAVGAGLGQMVSLLFPPEQAAALALLGMIGFFTGVVRAPMTAVIIVMEMTADRTMILPLFASALLADWVSAWLSRDKLYHALSLTFDDR